MSGDYKYSKSLTVSILFVFVFVLLLLAAKKTDSEASLWIARFGIGVSVFPYNVFNSFSKIKYAHLVAIIFIMFFIFYKPA